MPSVPSSAAFKLCGPDCGHGMRYIYNGYRAIHQVHRWREDVVFLHYRSKLRPLCCTVRAIPLPVYDCAKVLKVVLIVEDPSLCCQSSQTNLKSIEVVLELSHPRLFSWTTYDYALPAADSFDGNPCVLTAVDLLHTHKHAKPMQCD